MRSEASTEPERTTKPSTGYSFSIKVCLSRSMSHTTLFFVLSHSRYCGVQSRAGGMVEVARLILHMEIEVSRSPQSPLPFIVSGLVIDSRVLHVLHREHVVPIAPSPEGDIILAGIVEELTFAGGGSDFWLVLTSTVAVR